MGIIKRILVTTKQQNNNNKKNTHTHSHKKQSSNFTWTQKISVFRINISRKHHHRLARARTIFGQKKSLYTIFFVLFVFNDVGTTWKNNQKNLFLKKKKMMNFSLETRTPKWKTQRNTERKKNQTKMYQEKLFSIKMNVKAMENGKW